MGRIGPPGEARGAARCGTPDSEMAGKPRNAAGGPSRPTEGRHPLSAGVARGLLVVPAPRRNPRLSGGPRMAVKCVRINETWYQTLVDGEGISCEDAIKRYLASRQPTRRFVAAESVAGGVILLCGPAGRDITGAALPVDGGWIAS